MEDHHTETRPESTDVDQLKHAETGTGPGGEKDLPKRGRRGWKRALLTLGVVLVLAAGAVLVKVVLDRTTGEAPPAAGGRVDFSRPYAGTAAESWAEGLAGISAPAGQAVGGFTPAEVDAAFQQVRAAISAARLDPRALNQHDGTVLLKLLAPTSRSEFEPALTSRDPAELGKFLTLIGEHKLLPASPRMAGSLTAKPSHRKGELLIQANYVTAYAFDGDQAKLTSPADFVSFVRDEQNYVFRSGNQFAKGDIGLTYGEGSGYTSNMACDAAKIGILAPQYSDKSEPVDGKPSVEEADQYDPAKPLPTTGNCP